MPYGCSDLNFGKCSELLSYLSCPFKATFKEIGNNQNTAQTFKIIKNFVFSYLDIIYSFKNVFVKYIV